jgi:hypothetical protein
MKVSGNSFTRKEMVFGYELLSATGIGGVYKEYKLGDIITTPMVEYEILEGIGGDLNDYAGQQYLFMINGIHPMYQGDSETIIIQDSKLDTPNGGLKLKITLPENALGINIYVVNVDSDGVVDSVNPFKKIYSIYTEEREVEFVTKQYRADKFEGEALRMWYGFQANESYYNPFFVLHERYGLLDETEVIVEV